MNKSNATKPTGAGAGSIPRLVSPMVHNQMSHEAVREILDETLNNAGRSLGGRDYRLTFAEWLWWLESDPLLLKVTAGCSRNISVVKTWLELWRSHGCPCPLEQPYLEILHWLYRAQLSWPDLSRWANDQAQRPGGEGH